MGTSEQRKYVAGQGRTGSFNIPFVLGGGSQILKIIIYVDTTYSICLCKIFYNKGAKNLLRHFKDKRRYLKKKKKEEDTVF